MALPEYLAHMLAIVYNIRGFKDFLYEYPNLSKQLKTIDGWKILKL